MSEFYIKIYDQIKSKLFKESIFKEYHDFYDKGAYKEAYTVLRDIVARNPKLSKKGDLYVTFALLELFSNDDTDAAMKFLDKAIKLGCSDMAAYYGILGKVLWRIGDYKKTIQSLEKSVELNPSINNLKILGWYLTSLGDKRAIEIWKRILKKDSKNCIAYVYLAMEAEKAGNKNKANELFKKAEKYANSLEEFYELGGIYKRNNYFQKALTFYLKCEEMEYKTHSKLYSEITYCYLKLGEFNKTILYASKALHVDPNNDYAKYTLLQCTEAQINTSLLNDLLEKYPETCLSYILCAQNYKNNDYTKVNEFLSKAIQLKPSTFEMYYIGHLFHFIKHYEKAITTYTECEKSGYPYLSDLYGNTAICHFAIDNPKSALQYSVKSLELDFNNDYVKDMLLDYTKFKEASADFYRFLMKNPRTPLAIIINAQEAIRRKNISKARKLAAEALRLNPSLIELFYIADIYYDLENIRKALEIFHECEKLGFDDKCRLYLSLAYCYYVLEEFENSIDYAEKILEIHPNDNDAKELIHSCTEDK